MVDRVDLQPVLRRRGSQQLSEHHRPCCARTSVTGPPAFARFRGGCPKFGRHARPRGPVIPDRWTVAADLVRPARRACASCHGCARARQRDQQCPQDQQYGRPATSTI